MDKFVEFEIVSIDTELVTQGSFPGSDGDKVKFWECPADASIDGGRPTAATIRVYKYEDVSGLVPGYCASAKLHEYKGHPRLTITKATKGSTKPSAAADRVGKVFAPAAQDNRSKEINGSVAVKCAVDLCIAGGNLQPKSIRAWTREILDILGEAQDGSVGVKAPPKKDDDDGDDIPF